ncbi:GAF domain-containing sensor histidine kinase [Gemmatimonas sp.]|jgi:signal transduction histidine kinase|uniref:GAF domain-containing sensor histidine kinase n=1 Tax=Gemmatimonas sp. TaxID=1962908 RepID=UPI0037C1A380
MTEASVAVDHAPLPSADPVGPAIAVAAIEALYDCARASALEPDALALTRALAAALVRTFRADDVVVAAVVDSTLASKTRIRRHTLLSSPSLTQEERTFIDWLLQQRQPFAGRAQAARAAGAPESPWPDVIAVPALHHQGHPVALLLVAARRVHDRLGTPDLRVLETIAQQAAVAFNRAQLLAQLDSWSRGLEALFKFSAAVSSERDPISLVRDMAEHAARLLKADGGQGGLVVPGDTPEDLVMQSSAYWHDGMWLERTRRWPRNVGIPGVVLETEFPYLCADYAQDPAHEPPDDMGDIQYAVAVPIKNGTDDVLGFFELHRRDGNGAFSWQDAAFLESVANMAAVAIENARLGTALALKNQEMRALSARHVTRLEEERQHIARELHDEAGQALVGVKLSLQAMGRLVPTEVPALRGQLAHLRAQVNDAATRLKVLARRLRPPTLDRLGLDMALQQLAQESGEHYGFEVHLLQKLDERLPAELETALFRVTQEALTNAAAHAAAQVVEIRVEIFDRATIDLRISDNGVGFDPSERSSGLGLLGMRERVNMLGGQFAVTSAPGEGTTIRVTAPIL